MPPSRPPAETPAVPRRLCSMCTSAALAIHRSKRTVVHDRHQQEQQLGNMGDILQRYAECDLCELIIVYHEAFNKIVSYKLNETASYHMCRRLRDEEHRNPWLNIDEQDHLAICAQWNYSRGPAVLFEMQVGNASADRQPPRLARAVKDEVDLDVIRQWPRLCTTHHSRCQQSLLQPRISRPLDFTLIDVTNMCLVKGTPQHAYVALSYVWGDTTAQVKAVVSGLTDPSAPGSLLDLGLPQTIVDVIEVLRAIDEKYVWIDALCITTRDPAVRARQIAQMAGIYACARVTVVVTCGQDANSGLLGFRPRSRKSAQKRFFLDREQALLLVIGDPNRESRATTKWHTRAWTLQESVLSPRQLIWTDEQVWWACDQAVWAEEHNVETHNEQYTGGTAAYDIRDNPLWVDPRGGSLNASNHRPGGSHLLWHEAYMLARDEYLKRDLAWSGDTLNAFSAILNALCSEAGTQSLFGIPQHVFTLGLFWSMPGCRQNHASTDLSTDGGQGVVTVTLPSWSWAAWCLPSRTISLLMVGICGLRSELAIYRAAVDGRRARIFEQIVEVIPKPNDGLPPDRWQRDRWLHGPREFSAAQSTSIDGSWVDSGRLTFYASTSTAYIVSESRYWDIHPRPLGRPENRGWKGVCHLEQTHSDHAVSGTDIACADAAHFFCISDGVQSPGSFWNPLESDADVVRKEIMVVASDPLETEDNFLYCLLFDRIDGIAYRAGIARTTEADWIAMERKWELITLG